MESSNSLKFRGNFSSTETRSGSTGLFTMDSLFNKKAGSKSSDVPPSKNSNTPEETKKPQTSKFQSLGHRVTTATTSFDKFAKSTKGKFNKKLGIHDSDGDDLSLSPGPEGNGSQQDRKRVEVLSKKGSSTSSIVGGISNSEGVFLTPPKHPADEENATLVSPRSKAGSREDIGKTATCSSHRSYSADYSSTTELDSSDPPPIPASTSEGSAWPKKEPSPNINKLDKSLKVFGQKISHAAKATGQKMTQFGNEIEHGVAKLGHQLQKKDGSGSNESSDSSKEKNETVGGLSTPSPTKRISQDGGDGEFHFPRLHRRVSEVLEIDKANVEDGDLYIYDPAPEEYVSKISNMENLFADSAAKKSTDLSKPVTPHSIGSAVKKMKEKVMHNSFPLEQADETDDVPPMPPSSMSGHQDLDNWV